MIPNNKLIEVGKLMGFRRLSDPSFHFRLFSIDALKEVSLKLANIRQQKEPLQADLRSFTEVVINNLTQVCSGQISEPNYGFAGCFWKSSPNIAISNNLPDDENLLNLSFSIIQTKASGAAAAKFSVNITKNCLPTIGEIWKKRIINLSKLSHDFDLPLIMHVKNATNINVLLNFLQDINNFEAIPDLLAIEAPFSATTPLSMIKENFKNINRSILSPWILTTSNESDEEFKILLAEALRSGASGYLLNEMIWNSTIKYLPDWEEADQIIRGNRMSYIRELNAFVNILAHKWIEHPSLEGKLNITQNMSKYNKNYPAMKINITPRS